MGCSNSNQTVEVIENLFNSNIRVTQEPQLKLDKKIRKKIMNFHLFFQDMIIELKQNAYYDFLFKSQTIREYLNYAAKVYANHHYTVKIILIALDYMALSKNVINAKTTLKTLLTINNLPRQLSEKWTHIKKQIFQFNKKSLKVLKYLLPQDKNKEAFDHQYLCLKFDFSQREIKKVTKAVKQLCRYEPKAFCYLSNYLYISCLNQEKFNSLNIVAQKLIKAYELIIKENPLAPIISNTSKNEQIMEIHKNYKISLKQSLINGLKLKKLNNTEKSSSIENFIFDKVKESFINLTDYNNIIQKICCKYGYEYKAQLKLTNKNQKLSIMQIKTNLTQFKPKRQDFYKQNQYNNGYNIQALAKAEYGNLQKQLSKHYESLSQINQANIQDLIIASCLFDNIYQINQCCDDILKEVGKSSMKVIELSNQLRGGPTAPHIMIRILIDKTVCQLKLFLNYDLPNYTLFKYIEDLINPKHFSLIINLKAINQNITTEFVREMNKIIAINSKNTIEEYHQNCTYSEIQPSFNEFISLLPFKVDLSKVSLLEPNFNLVYEEVQRFLQIQKEFVNIDSNIDKFQKIRRVSQYLFLQKEFQLSELFLLLYIEEIKQNNSFLFDKIKKNQKQFIKVQIQMIKNYTQCLQILGQIYEETKSYTKAINFYSQYLPLISLVQPDNNFKIKIYMKLAGIYKKIGNSNESLKIYYGCIQENKNNDRVKVEANQLISKILLKQKKYQEALKCIRECLRIQQKLPAKTDSYPTLLKIIGEIYMIQESYALAAEAFQKAKENYEIIKGNVCVQVINLYKYIGQMYQKISKNAEAIASYKQFITYYQRIKGRYHIEIANILAKIAQIYDKIGYSTQSLNYYTQSLYLKERITGSNSLQCSILLNNIGIIHKNLGKKDEALRNFEISLGIKQFKIGRDSIEYIKGLMNIGVIHYEDGKSHQAIKYFDQALKIYEAFDIDQKLVNEIQYAYILNDFGLIKFDLGDFTTAMKYFNKSLEIKEKCENKPEIIETISNTGLVYEQQCKYEMALKNYEKCLKIIQLTNQRNTLVQSSVFSNIGTLYKHSQMPKEAERYYRKSISILEKLSQSRSKDYLSTLLNLAETLLNKKEYIQAEMLLQKANNLITQLSYENRIQNSIFCNLLGLLNKQNKDYEKAIQYTQRSLHIIRQLKGQDSIHQIYSLNMLGTIHLEQENFQQAIKYLHQTKKIAIKYGLKFRDYFTAVFHLGIVYFKLQKYLLAIQHLKEALMFQQKQRDLNERKTMQILVCCYKRISNESLHQILLQNCSDYKYQLPLSILNDTQKPVKSNNNIPLENVNVKPRSTKKFPI